MNYALFEMLMLMYLFCLITKIKEQIKNYSTKMKGTDKHKTSYIMIYYPIWYSLNKHN
jgi:hypothetical protein